MSFCSAYNCHSSKDVDRQLMFHRFPLKDPDRLGKWLDAVKRKDFKPSASSALCSLHFKSTDYDLPVICGNLRLKKDAVPSVFSFLEHLLPKKVPKRREVVKILPDEVQPAVLETSHADTIPPYFPEKKNVYVQTNLTGIELVETLQHLRRDKKYLQKQLARRDCRFQKMAENLKLCMAELAEVRDHYASCLAQMAEVEDKR